MSSKSGEVCCRILYIRCIWQLSGSVRGSWAAGTAQKERRTEMGHRVGWWPKPGACCHRFQDLYQWLNCCPNPQGKLNLKLENHRLLWHAVTKLGETQVSFMPTAWLLKQSRKMPRNTSSRTTLSFQRSSVRNTLQSHQQQLTRFEQQLKPSVICQVWIYNNQSRMKWTRDPSKIQNNIKQL